MASEVPRVNLAIDERAYCRFLRSSLHCTFPLPSTSTTDARCRRFGQPRQAWPGFQPATAARQRSRTKGAEEAEQVANQDLRRMQDFPNSDPQPGIRPEPVGVGDPFLAHQHVAPQEGAQAVVGAEKPVHEAEVGRELVTLAELSPVSKS